MKFLLIIFLVILSDRAIPAAAWRYGAPYLGVSEQEFFARYGYFAFPRTLLGVCACIAAGLDLVSSIDVTTEGVCVLILLFLFYVAAAIDVWRAARKDRRT